MMWFDKDDERAMFVDKRRETHMAKDCSVTNGERQIVIDPDIIADFTNLPFPDASFSLVVFDPPHAARQGNTSWVLKKYGKLVGAWRDMLRHGFEECFRVLKPDGTLIFKWAETQFPVAEILALTPERPLFGQRCGKTAKTHWIVFMKRRSG
jgi:SAM-dependent methyltransferase